MERDKGLTPKMIIGISANDQQKIAEEAKESGMAHHDIPSQYHTLTRFPMYPSYIPQQNHQLVLSTHPLINSSYQCALLSTHPINALSYQHTLSSTGMDGYMHKPIKLSTLINVIMDINDRRKQVRPYINHYTDSTCSLSLSISLSLSLSETCRLVFSLWTSLSEPDRLDPDHEYSFS